MHAKLAFVLVVLTAGSALAQDKAAAGAPADPKKAAEMQKMMEAWQKYGTPGPEHEKLKAVAGSYDVAVKTWMDPKAPPQESAGKAEFKTILGDRFVQQEFSGTFMGQPFNGQGLMGFNNVTKKYFSMWLDSTATGAYTGEGTANKEGVITFATTSVDPMTGKTMKGKDVLTPGADGFTYEIWGTMPKGGSQFKMMEMKYTKKK